MNGKLWREQLIDLRYRILCTAARLQYVQAINT